MHRLGRTRIWQTQTDPKIRVIETLFYIQFQGLCLKVWVSKDYLWARKVQEMKLSYYIRFRSFLDSVQKVHSQKLLKVKDKSICRLPEPREPLLARLRKEFGFINFNMCAVVTLMSDFRRLRFEWHQLAYLWQNIKSQETTRLYVHHTWVGHAGWTCTEHVKISSPSSE